MIEIILFISKWLSVIFAIFAAVAWYKSTQVEVDAPEDSHGVGALLGGLLIALNKNKKRIDLPATLMLQSKWNARGATFAYIAALMGALTWIIENTV